MRTSAPDRRARLRRGLDFLRFHAMLILFGLISLGWSLPAGLLYRLLPRDIGRALGQFMIMAGFRHFMGWMWLTGIARCDLTALDALRDEPRLVIVPNHPSLLDVVLVISRLPRVTCIMKAELLDSPFLGGGARLARYIRNDLPLTLIRAAAVELRAGRQLLIFPEGTRTRCQPINAFKGGFAAIAKAADAPVQTVFIETNSLFLGKGWPLFRQPTFPLVYRARLGRRFEVTESAQAFTRHLEAYFREELGAER